MSIDPRALLEAGRELIEREAWYLDEQRWDDWLSLFTEDCEYWVPAWRTEAELTTDPRAELSLIYYASRAGLEDRFTRIRSGKSPASTPPKRTTHMIGGVSLEDEPEAATMRMRASWTCHVFDPHRKRSDVFFGRAHYELVANAGRWLIAKKKTVLANDYMPAMLDVYCI